MELGLATRRLGGSVMSGASDPGSASYIMRGQAGPVRPEQTCPSASSLPGCMASPCLSSLRPAEKPDFSLSGVPLCPTAASWGSGSKGASPETAPGEEGLAGPLTFTAHPRKMFANGPRGSYGFQVQCFVLIRHDGINFPHWLSVMPGLF